MRRLAVRRVAMTMVAAAGFVFAQAPRDRIADAKVAPNGRVEIELQSGRHILAPAEKGQTDCSQIQVSADGQSVGWLVAFGNYGASYPIPTSLIVYRLNKPVRRFGNGFMLFEWDFFEDGAKVQFASGQVHGSNTTFYELYDVATGPPIRKWQEERQD